ncbi:bacillithiol biosynthesis cysteine-adding enzyme BshC [Aureitalea sp. L0-47]|uniref:bacillithiol biosynthesis cysteine-adding enzyme BshC n=1 Tax=Aureitalea sp. L0-47 TaxID=2816962 RepID=UPI002238CBE2|nr:bacillithiol biosynthesis cysteine-adding enzyme BshC [Aureitalea sp. L0-47]MCW5520299.1 bacillithiol biosynthesis cysteine-adding enzyme BshC [Aureitalea sp. L0-47]
MPIETIPYRKTGYFSKLICDYLDRESALDEFYHRFPSESEFQAQISERENFSKEKREVLVGRLKEQYKDLSVSDATRTNIDSLSELTTFTITTGHQLNLFTGPLYFLYKIFSVINLSEQMNEMYNDKHFVPLFWMASEDHDFDEINYFRLHGKKLQWNRDAGGAVGELLTDGLEKVLELFKQEVGNHEFAENIAELFKKAYLHHETLTEATRYLGNELFKEYGLVIVDGNDSELKRAFVPYAEMELREHKSFKAVSETGTKLKSLGYKEQVSPREINLFYITDGLRERIIEQDGRFHVNNSQIDFSKEEILEELKSHPERFSPNALLRPLYQEVILPNLCYVGGGGELAYWLQLKAYFDSVEVPFPMLLLRNSVLLINDKQLQKLKKLNASIEELFLPTLELENLHAERLSEIDIDFTKQRTFLKEQFASLYEVAKKTDASFLGAVAAQEKKQLNGLDKLEKRLLKAQRRKLNDQLKRLTDLQEDLFPGGHLQEREMNFSEFYLEMGPKLLETIKSELDPLVNKLSVIRL